LLKVRCEIAGERLTKLSKESRTDDGSESGVISVKDMFVREFVVYVSLLHETEESELIDAGSG